MAATLPRAVQDQLAYVLELTPDAFLVLDGEHRLVYLNAAGNALLGAPAGDRPGQTLWQRYPALAGTRLQREIRADTDTPEPRAFDEFHPALDRWLSARIYSMGDTLAVHLRDITESKRAEQALLASEAKFAGIVAIASDAIVAVDESQRIILFNTGAETIFGYRPDEVLGQPLDILIPERFRARHRADVGRFAEADLAARRMGERGEVTGRRRNGESFPAEASISKLELEGRRIFTAVLRDISERKRVEEELRLLQSLTVAITAAPDLPAAYAVTLEQVCRVVGWAYGEAWVPGVGRTFELAPAFFGAGSRLQAFHEASRTFAFDLGSGLPGEVLRAGQPVWIPDITSEPGYHRAELAAWAGLRTAVGIPVLAGERVVAVLVLYHFETGEEDERLVRLVSAAAAQLGVVVQAKQASQELARQAEELARSNAELEQFASVASHDLQEPLRKIQSFGDRLLTKYGSALAEEGQDHLRRMQDASGRMQALIQDLLVFSRVTTKAQPFATVDLEEVVREVASDLDARPEETGGTIEIGSIPSIAADRLQMRQLLQNLISNAIKFHPEGVPPRVRVSGRTVLAGDADSTGQPAERDLCEIFVEDAGIGFEERYTDRIFGVFQRLHGRHEYPGTGMGLAICRKIVERHGGRITARSAPGEGSTFIVALPRTQAKPKEVQV